MHLFSRLKNKEKEEDSFEEQYEILRQYAQSIMNCPYASTADLINNSSEIISICDDFIYLANNIDERRAVKKVIKEAKDDERQNGHSSAYPYHPDFKVICGLPNSNVWHEIIDSVHKIRNKELYLQKKINEFENKYKTIPTAPIEIDNETQLKRRLVMDMPEIRYSPVGKAFNRDKLLHFVIVDTETTGLRASSCKIIQLTAVKYMEWEPVEIWNTYINPNVKIPAEATKVNDITDEMVKNSPHLNQVAKSFENFIGDENIAGYNLPFDLKFLYASGITLNETKRKYYDVYQLAQKVLKKDVGRLSLSNVAEHYGIIYPAHNSLNDCLATGEVFDNLITSITSD